MKSDAEADIWARDNIREAASAALAEAGYAEDPRLRGAGHKIANSISQFLRSPWAEKPFVKSGKKLALHPEAHPPSWYSVAMIAAMPNLRRERAGFTERLGHYLAQPAPKKAFVIQVGKRSIKPQHLLLGDPIEADAKGYPKDVPLALHYIELLARMGALQWAPVATKVLARLLKDLDDERGVASQEPAVPAQSGQQDHLPLLSPPPRRQDHGGPRGGHHLPPGIDRQAARLAARLQLKTCGGWRSMTYYNHALHRSDPLRIHPH